MRRYTILLIYTLLMFPLSVMAQELRVDAVTLLEGDNSAVDTPRYDNNRQPCAMLKVYVKDMPDLTFNDPLVLHENDIKYEGGYYVVYVASGIRKLEVRHKDYSPATIEFKNDFGISVKGGKTYRVDLSADGVNQSVVFDIRPQPHNGKLVVDNKEYEVKDGILSLMLPLGVYDYKVTSDYHYDFIDTIAVDSVSEPRTMKVRLKTRMADVNFTCNAKEAVTLYVDNIKKGEPGVKRLPMGNHKIRVVAENWKDYVGNVTIDVEKYNLNVYMQPKDIVSVVIKAVDSDGNPLSSTPELYIDNKVVPNWENGSQIKVKTGKHLITIVSSQKTKEKIVKIDSDMEAIKILL